MVPTFPEVFHAMICKGSITVSWTGPDGTGTTTLPTGRNIRFNASKLEQVSAWDTMSGPILPSAVFVACPQLINNNVDIFNGVEKQIVGGAQFTGGAWLNINDSLTPIKYTSSCSDVIRGEFTVQVLNSSGVLITGVPNTTVWSVTISLWEK